jgi:hypothetical protein
VHALCQHDAHVSFTCRGGARVSWHSDRSVSGNYVCFDWGDNNCFVAPKSHGILASGMDSTYHQEEMTREACSKPYFQVVLTVMAAMMNSLKHLVLLATVSPISEMENFKAGHNVSSTGAWGGRSFALQNAILR